MYYEDCESIYENFFKKIYSFRVFHGISDSHVLKISKKISKKMGGVGYTAVLFLRNFVRFFEAKRVEHYFKKSKPKKCTISHCFKFLEINISNWYEWMVENSTYSHIRCRSWIGTKVAFSKSAYLRTPWTKNVAASAADFSIFGVFWKFKNCYSSAKIW